MACTDRRGDRAEEEEEEESNLAAVSVRRADGDSI